MFRPPSALAPVRQDGLGTTNVLSYEPFVTVSPRTVGGVKKHGLT